MTKKILFWDKIYYKEKKKNFALIDSKNNYKLWKQVLEKNHTQQNNLLVFPSAGLGNRLRVIASSWNIAEKIKKKIHFYWSINSDIACQWEDIFASPKIQWQQDPLQFSQTIHSSKKSHHVTTDIMHLGFAKENILYNQKYSNKNLNIYSCWLRDFPRNGIFSAKKFFSLLKPTNKVQKLLEEFLTPEKKKIGFHIRYTDAPIKRSKDWIFEWLKYLIKKYPKHEVVLVSDNQRIKDCILEIVPHGRICYQKTNLTPDISFSKDRANKLGMQIAAADLFALATCEVLWANKPNSSFYQSALFMNNLWKTQ